MVNFSLISWLSGNRTPWKSFFVLLFFVFIGMSVGQFIGIVAIAPWIDLAKIVDPNYLPSILKDPGYKTHILMMDAFVTLGTYIIGPLFYLRFYEKKKLTDFFDHNRFIKIPLLLTILIALAFMSVNSLLIEWNVNLVLLDFLEPFERWAQELEQKGQQLTEMMTIFDSVTDFILSLLVIGIIHSIGEEFLFRGLVQNQLFVISKNAHVAIWLAGFIFSLVHLQFYGLVPRMFLGVLFGYLYYWSGNLLVPILAHFVNNGLMLILLYLYQKELITYNIESSNTVSLEVFALSLVFGVLLMFLFKRYSGQVKKL